MRSPLERVRLGLFLLATIFAISVIGYRLAGYPWIEAIWMVVITIASVGYGERSDQPPAVQMLTIAVILFGFTAAAYLQKLSEQNRYRHTVWPPHCLIGTAGHCVQADLMNAVLAWEARQRAAANYITKGSNHFVEHFSAVLAAMIDAEDPSTATNIDLLNTLMDADRILVAGAGKGGTVPDTLLDAVNAFKGPTLAKKLIVLEDCRATSDSYLAYFNNIKEQLSKQGMKFMKSNEVPL